MDASNARAELGLAQIADRQKKWNTAASHYRRALELDPRNLPTAMGLGRLAGAGVLTAGSFQPWASRTEIMPARMLFHVRWSLMTEFGNMQPSQQM